MLASLLNIVLTLAYVNGPCGPVRKTCISNPVQNPWHVHMFSGVASATIILESEPVRFEGTERKTRKFIETPFIHCAYCFRLNFLSSMHASCAGSILRRLAVMLAARKKSVICRPPSLEQ